MSINLEIIVETKKLREICDILDYINENEKIVSLERILKIDNSCNSRNQNRRQETLPDGDFDSD